MNTLIQNTLLKYNFSPESLSRSITSWREPHRFYHNEEHLNFLVDKIQLLVDQEDKEILIIASVYHDIVCDPKQKNNEIKSIEIFLEDAKQSSLSKDQINIITECIQVTSQRIIDNVCGLPFLFWQLDNSILSSSFDKLLEYEHKIFKEFQFARYSTYATNRVKFLNDEFERTKNYDLQRLAVFVKNRKPSVGVYCGSFDPFHKGHLNILEKAELIFDKVIIVRGNNPSKNKTLDYWGDFLPKLLQNREHITWSGLTTELLDNLSAECKPTLIRGLRDGKDLDYEVNQLRFMQELLPSLNVCFIHCDKEYEHISSSAINALAKFDENLAKKYLVNDDKDGYLKNNRNNRDNHG